MKFYNCQKSTLLLVLLASYGCQRSAQFYLIRGNRFFAEDKFEEAALNYRNSIKANSQNAESYYRLGLAEIKLGQTASAYDELVRAKNLAPSRQDISVELANLALEGLSADQRKPQVLYDQVVEVGDNLLKSNANSFDGLRLHADVLTLDGKLDEALTFFRKANAIKPLEPVVVLPMLQVLLQLKQKAEAEDLAKSLIAAHKDVQRTYDLLSRFYIQENRIPEAEGVLKSQVVNLPKDPGPVVQLASFYLRLQRESDVSQTVQKILNNSRAFPDGHEIVGDFYADNRRWDSALQEYNAGLKSKAKDKALYQKKIVKVLIAEGKREDAIQQLNDELRTFPDDLDSRIARAILLREANDPKRLDFAISEMNAILSKNPNDEVVHYNLGLAYLTKGDLGAARSQLLESSHRRKDYLPPRLALAELAQKTGNYQEAIGMANEVLSVDPSNADARLWHAAGLLGSKAYGQARRELDALLREHPDSMNVNLHLAVLDTTEKRYREADALFLKLYKPGQQDLRPLEGLVQLYTVQGQTDKALKLLKQELKLAPDSRAVHLLVAANAVRAGQLDLATAQYEWLRANDPKSVEAYASLGDLYQLKGDLNSALDSYQKARGLAPNDPRIIAMVAFLETSSGQDREAIENLRKQLAIDPENAIALNNLAFALAETGTDLDQALSLAEKAQRKVPNNPGISDTLAWVYTKKGLNDSAIQIFHGLVKKYPEEAAFRYHLGVALLQRGQTEEAKAEFVISLSKNPPKAMAEKIKQIIAKIG